MSGHTTHEVVGEVSQALGVLEVSPTAEEIVQRVAAVAPSKQRRVGRRRVTPMEHFSVGPPPNRTCGFHRIRLSSV